MKLTTPKTSTSPVGIQATSRSGAVSRNQGFTLIELLVVVLIIGIVLTFVSLSIDVNGRVERLDRAAHRLLALTRTAATDAVLYGAELGLDITPDGYRFVRLGSDGWQVVTDESTLRPRELDPDLQLLRIMQDDGKRTLLPQAEQAHNNNNADDGDIDDTTDEATFSDADKDSAKRRPVAIFLSSGELLPFVLELSAQGLEHRYQLQGHAGGKIELNKIGTPP